MPDITFILPHWIYWGGIFAVPLFLMLAARRGVGRRVAAGVSLPVAYFFWVVSGFIGFHRLYLKNWGAAIFILLFVGVIFCNHEARLARNAHSIVKNEAFNISYDLEQAQAEDAAAEDIAALESALEAKTEEEQVFAERTGDWHRRSLLIAIIVLCLMIADAFLMPRHVRRARAMQSAPIPPPLPAEEEAAAGAAADGRFVRAVGKLNRLVGEFVSYWTVIAVFVFYYEVIARYIFNSPTVWAHESMFLLFGMQYMLAGGFCLRENAHVRVDVIYVQMTARARAIADLATSVFFFIFTVSLLVTGWIFFSDSFAIRQVSYTEWEIPYWPIKFALPLGGALIILQGVAHVLRDIAALRRPANGH